MLLVPLALAAAAVAVDLSPCVAPGAHPVVEVSLAPSWAIEAVRANFRRQGAADGYWVEMAPTGGGRYRAALPAPSERGAAVETSIAAFERGSWTAVAEAIIPVDAGCGQVAPPGPFALAVGESSPAQRGALLAGFDCDGVVVRVGADGRVAADDACRAVLLDRAAALVLGAGPGPRVWAPFPSAPSPLGFTDLEDAGKARP